MILGFYGDDFTGSTDVLEVLSLGGIQTVLFLDPPTPERLAAFPQVEAVGIAGISRSLPTAQMAAVVAPALRCLRDLGPDFVHYKICSTFDSSPEIGSIGHVVDLAAGIFGSGYVPLVVGAPRLKRYVAFGNLFATVEGETHRLDRHPTMARHPVTPMGESDLRRHLARQTQRRIDLVDVLAIEQGEMAPPPRAEICLYDTLNSSHLVAIGRHLERLRGRQPRFLCGSSGIEYALCAHGQATGSYRPLESFPPAWTAPALVVMTGSAAPATAAQISWALEHGWTAVPLDGPALIDPDQAEAAIAHACARAVAILDAGGQPLLHAARGPEDPAIAATRTRAAALGIAQAGEALARAQGRLLQRLLEARPQGRVCVAGGDTSGYAARALGIDALEFIRPLAPGAPLCRARSATPAFDGLEIVLKAGQIGTPDFFKQVRQGRLPDGPQ